MKHFIMSKVISFLQSFKSNDSSVCILVWNADGIFRTSLVVSPFCLLNLAGCLFCLSYTTFQGLADYFFRLNYATLDDALGPICQIHRASTLPPAEQAAMVRLINIITHITTNSIVVLVSLTKLRARH